MGGDLFSDIAEGRYDYEYPYPEEEELAMKLTEKELLELAKAMRADFGHNDSDDDCRCITCDFLRGKRLRSLSDRLKEKKDNG